VSRYRGSRVVAESRRGSRPIVGRYRGSRFLGGTAPVVIPPPPGPVGYYAGARIDGSFQNASRGSSTADDAPFSIAMTHPNTYDTFAGFNGFTPPSGSAGAAWGSKHPAHINWGGSPSAWPPTTYVSVSNPTNAAAAANLVKTYGGFSHTGLNAPQSAVNEIVATDQTSARANLGPWFNQFRVHGYPALFRPWHEFNGWWYDWGLPHQVSSVDKGLIAADFIKLWRNTWQICADVMSGTRDGVNTTAYPNGGTPIWGTGTHTGNLAFVWSANYVVSATSTVTLPGFGGANVTYNPRNEMVARYPGDAYVDWTSWDGYLRAGGYQSPSQLFDYVYGQMAALAPSKPMFIAEFGVMASVGNGTTDKARWFTDFFDTWLSSKPLIRAFSYFNEAGNDGLDVHIENPEGARVIWADRIQQARFITNPGQYFTTGQKPPVPAFAG
jgi:hypothetical protein